MSTNSFCLTDRTARAFFRSSSWQRQREQQHNPLEMAYCLSLCVQQPHVFSFLTGGMRAFSLVVTRIITTTVCSEGLTRRVEDYAPRKRTTFAGGCQGCGDTRCLLNLTFSFFLVCFSRLPPTRTRAGRSVWSKKWPWMVRRVPPMTLPADGVTLITSGWRRWMQ